MSLHPTPEEQPSIYPFNEYLLGLQPHDDLLLQRLGGIVAQEIDLGVRPFASLAIEIAELDDYRMMTAQYRPMPKVIIRPEETSQLQEQRVAAGETRLSNELLRDEVYRHKYEKVKQRHDLGILTCNLAVAFADSKILERVALIPDPESYDMIQPTTKIWEVLRNHNSVPHYRNYVDASTSYAANLTEKGIPAARSSLLVAVAAYAVHTSKIT